jgi:cobalt transporter subunit CbtA
MPLSGAADFRHIVRAALISGVITGVLITLVQLVTTVPLIAQAEVYERARTQNTAQENHMHADTHDHAGGHDSNWEPRDGLERTLYTGLTTILAAFGYALLLGAALSLTRSSGWRAGLAFGTAGLVVFQLAPALGMPPEPPGVPVSDLAERQLWWLGTVTATTLAFACWYFARTHSKRLWIPAGIVLICLPHVFGVPSVPAEMSSVPEELVRRFSILALCTAALFWLTLGAMMGYVYGNPSTRDTLSSTARSA